MNGDHKTIEQLRSRLSPDQPLNGFLADLCESVVLRSSSKSERYSDNIGPGTILLDYIDKDYDATDTESDQTTYLATNSADLLLLEITETGTYCIEFDMQVDVDGSGARTITLDALAGYAAGVSNFWDVQPDSICSLPGVGTYIAATPYTTSIIQLLNLNNTVLSVPSSKSINYKAQGILCVGPTLLAASSGALNFGIRGKTSGGTPTVKNGYLRATKLR